MVKKNLMYLFIGVLLASCEKDALLIDEEFPIPVIEASNDIKDEILDTDNEPLSNWIAGQKSATGLFVSSENSDFVSLYDNALATLLFIKQGELEKAASILNFFENRAVLEFQTQTGGFYQFRNANGENGSRKWLGDNAWLLIAIHHYHEATNTTKYKSVADKLENWIRSLQDTDGGLIGGYNEDGSIVPKVTEGILTAYNAVPGYDDFHKNILNYLKLNRWDATLRNLNSWPEKPAYANALDVLSISQGVLEDFPKESLQVADALFLTSQKASISGEEITGYCFDEDKDVVWLEGTAQMSVALQTIGEVAKSEELLTQIEKTFIRSFTTRNAEGIPYTTNYGTNYGRGLLWDHADIAPALSSTIWYLFAKIDFNPFLLGKEKNIPASDRFWSI